jgi:hypothetical protein
VGLVLDDWNWCFSALPFFDLDHTPSWYVLLSLHTAYQSQPPTHLPISPHLQPLYLQG